MYLPQQRLPLSKKGTEWKQACVDYFESISKTSATGRRTTNYRKLVNYDLFNGRFSKQDLSYVCNPLGIEEEFPATLQHYDIISPAIMLLLGEETKRPDNFLVVSEGEKSVNRKTKGIQAKVLESLYSSLMAEVDPASIDPNNPPPTPEQIIKYERYTPSDIAEVKSNKILKELKKKLNTKLTFSKGWKDALIAGEEIYWTGVSNGRPDLRRCNPADITVVLEADSDFIDDAVAVIEERYMSIPAILDEFGEDLSANDVRELEELAKTGEGKQSNINIFKLRDLGVEDSGTSVGSNPDYLTMQGFLKVVRIEWISLKKKGILTYTDELEQLQNKEVDETFDIALFQTIDPTAKVEWFWVPEAWEGIKIGLDKYVNIQAKNIQRRRHDDPYYCKLGYSGLVYNATNSVSVSLIDRLKPYQYLYNVLMYRMELAFASDQGKIMLMDLAQIPRSEGIDLDKWMYYLKAMKIGFVNSFEEGKGKFTGKNSTFNQFQSIDLSLANTIQQYVQSLEYIKQQVAFVSGISPQRLGAIDTRESVGNVERSVSQSALITEYWFDAHTEVKRRVYTSLIECAKIAYRNGYSSQFVMDDMGIETLTLEEFELEDIDLAVYVTDSSKDLSVLETMKSLFQTGLQADKVNFSDIAKVLTTNSIAEITRSLEQSEAAYAQRQAEAGQQQNDAAMQQIQAEQEMRMAELQLEYDKLDREDINKQLDRENDIQEATIKALGFSKNTDVNQNQIPDVWEQSKLALEQTEISFDQMHRTKELQADKEDKQRKDSLKEKELKLKEKDLQNKQNIEKLKIRQIEVQNKSQEKMQEKELKIKEKEIKLKAKALKAKPKPKK